MPDLGAVYGGGNWRRTLALAGAVGALLAGLLAVTAGSAKLLTSLIVGLGIPATPARQIAIATASTVPPVVLGAAIVYFQPNRRFQVVGLAGVAVALTGVAVGLPMGFDPVAPLVGAIYGLGLVLVLGSLVHGFLTADEAPESAPSTVWEPGMASSTHRSSGTSPMPADGGEDDDGELTFLIEDENEE